MEKLTQKSCSCFAEALASKEPVPGGGGAAALVGALGIALSSMVGNFTVGKIKYSAVEEDIKTLQIKSETLRLRLLELVEEDAMAFIPLSKAYAISKDDPTYDQEKEKACLNACKAPIEVMKLCAEALDVMEEMLEKGNKMLVSDVGCGALLCRAAMESAAMNIYINTKALTDCSEANLIESKVDNLINDHVPKADKIIQMVMKQIR